MKLSKKLNKLSGLLYKIEKDKRIKYYYKIGNNHIFVFIIQDISGLRYGSINIQKIKIEAKLKNSIKIIETKLPFQFISTKQSQKNIYSVGAYSITNASDDQCRKIMRQLDVLNFKQFGQETIHTRNPFTITTQCSFY